MYPAEVKFFNARFYYVVSEFDIEQAWYVRLINKLTVQIVMSIVLLPIFKFCQTLYTNYREVIKYLKSSQNYIKLLKNFIESNLFLILNCFYTELKAYILN